jgi:hypothetical protein
MAITSFTARLALLVSLVLIVPTAAVEWTSFEGTARGFPVLRDIAGKKIGDGDFVQWLENGRLHVRIVYSGRTRRIEENSVFRQRPELVQEQWSLRELRDGKLYRQFAVNFTSGTATAKKFEDGELKDWSDELKVDVGRAFAGFGFTLATKALRRRLVRGEKMELQAVGFSPKPRVVTVEISYGGLDRVPMGGRTIRGERYIVHPKLPLIADLFVNVPDAHIWLTSPAPAAFLRWEGPLAEPSDPITRVDLLPGGSSGPATPVATTGRRD